MISLIAAMDRNRNIGLDGDMPWGKEMPSDLRRFQTLTLGNVIVMGRKTFESLPFVLPQRKHIVLTRDKDFTVDHPDVLVADDFGIVLLACQLAKDTETFVIGGAQIYKQFLPHADKIHLTKIHELFEGDTKFPSIVGAWDTVYGEKELVEGDKYPSQYITFTRRA